jgi:hypothetical protein
MFIENPVIVRIREEQFGTPEVVMRLGSANAWVKHFQKRYGKFAYRQWLLYTKCMFECIVCGEDDPSALNFHHIGERIYRNAKETVNIFYGQ